MRCRSITAKEAPTDNLLTRLNQANVTTPLREKRGSFVVDDTLGCSLLFASLFSQNPNNFAIVANNLYSAQRIYEFLLNFLNEDQVVFFPSDELLRAESLASGRELLSQRLYALGQLQSPKKKILVTHPAALLRYLPDPKRFAEETLHFKTGDHCDLTKLKARLVEMGYQGINKIEHSLEFASRGDILDVYSVSYLDPIRIEFFDDQIESIRTFDIQSQSSKSDLKECTILPATDIFLNDDELSDFMIRAKEQLNSDKSTLPPALGALLEQNVGLDLENFVTHDYKNELYKYYGFALQKHFSVLSYFDPEIVYIANKEQFVAASDLLINEAHDYFSDLQIKARIISHLEEYMPVEKAIPSKRNVIYSHTYATTADDLQFVARPIITTGTNIANIIPTIETYLGSKDQVVLALHEKHQIETVESFLQDQKIPFERVQGFDLPQGSLAIADLTLSEGFEIPSLKIAYLSANELFGHKIASSRFTSRFKDATILRSYEDLHPGDYVVHEYNGIGQFLGIKTIEQNGIHRDYLHIAYAGNEFLYVPLEQFRLVRKYAGKEGAAPRLSHLSSGEWEKKKAHIKARVNELGRSPDCSLWRTGQN
jgi:transcription-repair coupling factor (superfamily II helicase)